MAMALTMAPPPCPYSEGACQQMYTMRGLKWQVGLALMSLSASSLSQCTLHCLYPLQTLP